MKKFIERILVTGGAGFIGSHLVELLIDRGKSVTILDDFSNGKLENLSCVQYSDKLRIIEGSILDIEKVSVAMSGCSTIIHLAAISSVQESVENPFFTHQVNFDGTLILLEEARRQGVARFIYSSSASVYGDRFNSAIKESDAPFPLTPYAIDKLSSEYYIDFYSRSYGIETTVCRFFNVYGPRQDPLSPYSGVISIFIDRASKGNKLKIFGDGLQTRDFVYVKYLSRTIISLINNKESYGKVVNIGSGERVSLIDLAARISDALNVQVALEFDVVRMGDIRDSLADVKLLHSLNPTETSTPIALGLSEMLDAYRVEK